MITPQQQVSTSAFPAEAPHQPGQYLNPNKTSDIHLSLIGEHPSYQLSAVEHRFMNRGLRVSSSSNGTTQPAHMSQTQYLSSVITAGPACFDLQSPLHLFKNSLEASEIAAGDKSEMSSSYERTSISKACHQSYDGAISRARAAELSGAQGFKGISVSLSDRYSGDYDGQTDGIHMNLPRPDRHIVEIACHQQTRDASADGVITDHGYTLPTVSHYPECFLSSSNTAPLWLTPGPYLSKACNMFTAPADPILQQSAVTCVPMHTSNMQTRTLQPPPATKVQERCAGLGAGVLDTCVVLPIPGHSEFSEALPKGSRPISNAGSAGVGAKLQEIDIGCEVPQCLRTEDVAAQKVDQTAATSPLTQGLSKIHHSTQRLQYMQISCAGSSVSVSMRREKQTSRMQNKAEGNPASSKIASFFRALLCGSGSDKFEEFTMLPASPQSLRGTEIISTAVYGNNVDRPTIASRQSCPSSLQIGVPRRREEQQQVQQRRRATASDIVRKAAGPSVQGVPCYSNKPWLHQQDGYQPSAAGPANIRRHSTPGAVDQCTKPLPSCNEARRTTEPQAFSAVVHQTAIGAARSRLPVVSEDDSAHAAAPGFRKAPEQAPECSSYIGTGRLHPPRDSWGSDDVFMQLPTQQLARISACWAPPQLQPLFRSPFTSPLSSRRPSEASPATLQPTTSLPANVNLATDLICLQAALHASLKHSSFPGCVMKDRTQCTSADVTHKTKQPTRDARHDLAAVERHRVQVLMKVLRPIPGYHPANHNSLEGSLPSPAFNIEAWVEPSIQMSHSTVFGQAAAVVGKHASDTTLFELGPASPCISGILAGNMQPSSLLSANTSRSPVPTAAMPLFHSAPSSVSPDEDSVDQISALLGAPVFHSSVVLAQAIAAVGAREHAPLHAVPRSPSARMHNAGFLSITAIVSDTVS